jgi:hypothetical protein
MNLPEPLRNNPFRLPKRKSLHSELFGEGRPKPVTRSGTVPCYGTPTAAPNTYMSSSPNEYVPHPGSTQVRANEYEAYDASTAPTAPPSNHPGMRSKFRTAASERAGFDLDEAEVQYEDSLMNEEIFQQQLDALRQNVGEPLPIVDRNEMANRIMAAHKQGDGFDMEQDTQDLLEIQMAVEQARRDPLTDLDPESPGIGPTIPQDFFEQQEEMLEAQYHESDHESFDYGVEMDEMFNAQEALFDALQSGPSPMEEAIFDERMEGVDTMGEPMPETLEDMIEAEPMQDGGAMPDDMVGAPGYDGCPIGPELLEEQMHDVTEQMEPRYGYPDPLQAGYGIMPEQMSDEPIPDMMDPYMTPDMMDPYMMPGASGLGPMLDPGPGGGP